MRIFSRLLVTVVIAWGLLALLVRAAAPLLADQRDALAAELTDRLGVPVQIGALRLRWYGLGPLVEIDRLTLGEKPQALSVAHALVEIEPSGIFGDSVMDAVRLTLDGLTLSVTREADEKVHLEGLGAIHLSEDSKRTPPPLPGSLRLLNTRMVWTDRNSGKPPLVFERVAIEFDRDGDHVGLRARLASAAGTLDVGARLRGRLWTTDWSGWTHLKLDNLAVASLLSPFLPPDYALDSLVVDLESWDHWRAATLVRSEGRIQLRDLKLRGRDSAAAPLQLTHAGGRFRLERETDRLRLDVRGLWLDFPDHRWPGSDLALAITRGGDGPRQLDLALDRLDVAGLARILSVRPPSARLGAAIAALRPTGALQQLRLTATLDADDPQWRASTNFSGLGTQAWQQIPGIDNLSGHLHAQTDHLQLELHSRDSQLHFAELFRAPLTLAQLDGRIDLLRHGDGDWTLHSDRISAVAPHLRTATRIQLRQRPDQPLHVDLQTNFSDGDAGHASGYYPVGIMSDELVAWLDRSIKSGRIPSGSALLYGPLDDFAFDNSRSGSFQVVFDTEDVELDYHQDWPSITGLDAQVRFHGNQLDIVARDGQILDNRITRLGARIDRLNPVSPIAITGQLDGRLADTLRVLHEDALRPRFGHFADGLRAQGDARLLLDFAVPLGSEGAYTLDGRLDLDNATLTLPDRDFTLSRIHGQLRFDLDGLTANGIKARALNTPVRLDVSPLANSTTRVRANLRLDKKTLARQLPSLPLQAASGGSSFVIDVEIPPTSATTKSPIMLAVQSDLAGMRIDLPPPFGKTAAQRKALRLRLPLDDDNAPASLRYADLLSARFDRAGRRIDLMLGGAQATLGKTAGVRIGGRLDELDLAAWSAALAHASGLDHGTSTPLQLDLDIGRVIGDPITLEQLHLRAMVQHGRWRGEVDAPDLGGRFDIPSDPQRGAAKVALKRLRLSVPVELDDGPSEAPDPTRGVDPRTLPGLDLTIDELTLNQAKLGRLRLNAARTAHGLALTQFSLDGGELSLDGAGRWTYAGDRGSSNVSGKVGTQDLGELLVGLGYSRQLAEAGAEVAFKLAWPGDPAQLSWTTLGGSISVDVGAGRLVDLDPGVPRMIGLLNLHALARRLRLDFRDLTGKGHSFDSIKGDFTFDDGIAKTDKLTVLGPTGRLDLDGTADLRARTLDQHVTFVPNLDATLPIASTLAGGPVAGVAALVAQTVMSDKVDRINRFEYQVRGPWDDPVVEQLDTGGTLSKILRPLTGKQVKPTDPEPAAADAGRAAPAQAPDDNSASADTPGATASKTQPEAAGRAVAAQPLDDNSAPADMPEAQPQSKTTAPARDKADQQHSDHNPLHRLLDVFKKGTPHGAELPGEGN